jgi:hypothetical protein
VVARPSVRLVLQALRDEAHEFLLLHA